MKGSMSASEDRQIITKLQPTAVSSAVEIFSCIFNAMLLIDFALSFAKELLFSLFIQL